MPEQQFRGPPGGVESSVASREALEVELQSAEARLERARDQDGEFARTLEAMESELASAKRWTDRAWDRAMRCLTEWEARASEAERNAVRAEELAKRLSEQKVWEQRLRVLLDRINRAENRAATEPSSGEVRRELAGTRRAVGARVGGSQVVPEPSLTPTVGFGSTRPSQAPAGRRSARTRHIARGKWRCGRRAPRAGSLRRRAAQVDLDVARLTSRSARW